MEARDDLETNIHRNSGPGTYPLLPVAEPERIARGLKREEERKREMTRKRIIIIAIVALTLTLLYLWLDHMEPLAA